jgi:outer membrane autotransporter protein
MPAFRLLPLRRSLRAVSLTPLFLLSPDSLARSIGEDTTIDGGTPIDNYSVVRGATLTATGAATREITVNAGSTLIMDSSSVTVTNNLPGIRLSSSTGRLDNTRVTAERQGLVIGVDLSSADRASSEVSIGSGSVITGGTVGASINNSRVSLVGSELRGTNDTAVGADLFDSDLQAQAGSRIVGGQNGVRFRGGSGLPAREGGLRLDGSHVEGLNGSAIAIGTQGSAPASATIEILNGSTLKGANGTLVEVGGVGTADIRVDASALEGDVIVAEGGTAKLLLENRASLKGRLDNLEQVALNSGGQWTLVEDARLERLTLDGGSVVFGDNDEFRTLQVANLAGNGTFVMNVDFATGDTDRLDVTGTATGNHQILVTSTGTDPLADTNLHMVHAEAGDASFSLAGGPVDLGTFAYGLVQRDNDWYLDASLRELSNGTKTALALFNTAPTVWYGELSTLRSRMGEVRRNDGAAGGWLRSYGNRYDASTSGFDYTQRQHGLSFGADGRLPMGDGNWLAGVTAGYSRADLDLQGGSSGKVDSYHVGAYTTWIDPQDGYYFDGMVKFNRYQNSADVQVSDGTRTKGDFDNHGIGLSLEVGRHVKLGDGYFVEPYAQLAAMTIEGKSYQLDNGLEASGDDTRSLQGKLGATAGRTFEYGQGRMIQPYLRVAAAHEFVDNNRVRLNDNRFDNDLAGSRGEVGVGLVGAWTDRWQAHAELDYANGKQLEQPWGVSLGVRYNW